MDSRPVFTILLTYSGATGYTGNLSREKWLDRLANHFRGQSEELRKTLTFWDQIDSARQYGLISVNFDMEEPLENLRELVLKCEVLEVLEAGKK